MHHETTITVMQVDQLPIELLKPAQIWLQKRPDWLLDRNPIRSAKGWTLGSEKRVDLASVPELQAIRAWLVDSYACGETVYDFTLAEIIDEVPKHIDDRILHRIGRRYMVHLLNSEGTVHTIGKTILTCTGDGAVLRFNNSRPHHSKSASSAPRYSAVIDFIHPRLLAKLDSMLGEEIYPYHKEA